MGNVFGGGGSNNKPDKLFGVKVNSSDLGKPVTWGMGTFKANQLVFWEDGFKSRPGQSKKGGGGGGKGGGKGSSTDLYSVNLIAGLGAGPIVGIGDMWAGQSWLGSPHAVESYTIAGPDYSYTPTNAAAMINDYGVSPASTYTESYNDYSSPVSTVVANPTSTPFAKVAYGTALTSGTYSVNPATGTYHYSSADVGKTVQMAHSYLLTEINQQENDIIPAGKTIQVGGNKGFDGDLGVVYAGTGANAGNALTRVNGTPTAAGTYAVSGSAPATYRFSTPDIGALVTLTFKLDDPNAVGQNQSTMLDFTLAEGYIGQSPYSFLQGSYPGAALGYSGVATVLYEPMDLGMGGEPQQNSFEVITPDIYGGVYGNGQPILDCNPVQCIQRVLTDPVQGLGVGAIPFPPAFIDNGPGGTWGEPGTPSVQSVGSTAWNWFAANNFFISPVMDSQDSADSAMSKWLEAGMCSAFVSEGLLKMVPFGDTTVAANGCTWTAPTTYVAALDDTCFVAKEGQDPVTIKRSSRQDAMNKVQVQWQSRGNQYANEITEESDQSLIDRFGERTEGPQDYPFIHSLMAATFAANMRLKHGTYILNTYEFRLPFIYSYLECMDLVTLTTSSVWAQGINNTNLGVTNLPVRITKIVDDPTEGLKIEAEDYPFGAGCATLFNKGQSAAEVVSNAFANPGTSEVVLFEATGRLVGYQGNQIWMGACGTGENYGSTNVYVSQDNENYVQVAQLKTPSVLGTLAQELPVTADPDTTSSLVVQLAENCAPLASGTTEAADNDTMLCFVDGEVVSYSAAAVTGQNVYTMGSYLRRGQLGTTISDHAIGSLFLRLDGSIAKYTYDPTWQGKTIYFKFQAVNNFGNNPQALSSLTAVPMTLADTNSGTIDASTGLINSPLAQQVTNVTASESAYKTGSMQSLVAIDFTPAPGDSYFGAVDIYFTGYNGNPLPQLMANVTAAPAEFLCETTGETCTVTVVSVSTSGHESSFSAAPTTTVTLNGVTTAPPYPSIYAAQSALPDGKGWQFTFNVIGGLESDLISGYRIYHAESASSTSPAYYDTKVQPPTNVGTITVSETTGDLLWYWISSINTAGLESELIAIPFQYIDPGAAPPTTTPVTTTQTYLPTVLVNGWGVGGHVQYCESQNVLSGSGTWGTCKIAAAAYTNPASAYDGNQTTAAYQTQTHNAAYAGCIWTFAGNTLPPGATVTGATLSVVSDVQATSGISGEASIWYSTNSGTTWTNIYTDMAHPGSPRAKQTDTVTLPTTINPANLLVMANFHSHDDLRHDVYEISLAVTQSSVAGPEAVTGVTAKLVSGNVQISWNGLAPLTRTDILNYQVYRSAHGAGFTISHLEATIPSTNAATYSWTDLAGHDGSWSYWVLAQNNTGYSPASSEATLFSGGSLLYSTGQTAEDLRPAAYGADVTSANTSANTVAVGIRSATEVQSTVIAGGGVDFASNLHANKTLDSIGDGGTYARVKGTGLTNGGVNYASGSHTGLLPLSNHAPVVALAATGSQRNLVPDSDLKFGSAYWTMAGLPVVSGLGGDGGNAFAYTGTGSASGYVRPVSATMSVTPGATYTLSCYMDATAVTSGSLRVGVLDSTLSTWCGILYQVAGVKGRVSVSFTMPVGVTQAVTLIDTNNITAPNGAKVVWSNPQLEVGSVATAYKSNLIDDSTGSLAHGTMSTAVQSAINTGGTVLNVGGVTSANVFSRLTSANLIPNADSELGPIPGIGGVLVAPFANAYSGTYCRVALNQPNTGLSPTIQCSPGDVFTLSVMACASCSTAESSAMLYMSWRNAAGSEISGSSSVLNLDNRVWYARSFTATTPAGAVGVAFYVISMAAGITYYLDNLMAYKVTPETIAAQATGNNLVSGALTAGKIDFGSGLHQNKDLDHISDGGTYLKVPRAIFGSSGNAIDLNGNLKLKNRWQVLGVTVNPAIANLGVWADLPELNSSNPAMISTNFGNPCLVGGVLSFWCGNVGTSFSTLTSTGYYTGIATGSSCPTITITITGNGTGASASVSWSSRVFSSVTIWTPSISLTPGSGYTYATANVTVTIPIGTSYNGGGTGSYTCTLVTFPGSSTTYSGIGVEAQILLNGVPISSPCYSVTDGYGNASINLTQLVLVPAGTNYWDVQAANTGAHTVVSTSRNFQLIELG